HHPPSTIHLASDLARPTPSPFTSQSPPRDLFAASALDQQHGRGAVLVSRDGTSPSRGPARRRVGSRRGCWPDAAAPTTPAPDRRPPCASRRRRSVVARSARPRSSLAGRAPAA